MKTTDIYGFPYAEGGDPRRNFPATVDQPRTEAIEAALAAATEHPPHGRGSTNGTAVPANTWTLMPLAWTQLDGGASAAGAAAVVPAGMYLCIAKLYPAPAGAQSFWQARLGTAAAHSHELGGGSINANEQHWNQAAAMYSRMDGEQIALWVLSSVARNINYPTLEIHRIGGQV